MKAISIVKTNLVLFAVVVLVTASVLAAPFAKKIPFTQPDGTEIELWGEGDEFYAVFETLDGYTVVFDPQTKAYHYAQLSADGNNLISAGVEVGKRDPAALGLAKHVRIKPEAVKKRAFERFQRWDQAMQVSTRWKAMKGERRQAELAAEGQGGSSGLQPSPPGSTTTGTKVGLCLLIDFSDAPATVPQAEIVNFCNGDNYTGYGNNGSVKKYYLDNSNNLLTYTNVVTIYIRAPQLKTYYNDTSKDCGQQARLLIADAIAVMKALPDYNTVILPTFNALTVDGSNNVVAFNVFYAGGNGGVWLYGLWPHSWMLASPLELSAGGKKVSRYQISNIGSTLEIGTFCHENGHMLCGFPDIYDYDYDSWGGAGFFCLMDYGLYGGNPQGSNPVQICAYLKRAAGWANVTDLTSTSNVTATVTAAPTAGYNNYYRCRKPGVSTEYFLVENRQQTGHDASIPAAGVAVWHIDELGDKDNQSLTPNTTNANYEVTLVQADNRWDFEYNRNGGDAEDLYYAGNFAPAYSNRLDDYSSPNTNWWDGTSSGINFRDFSVSGTSMTFISRIYTQNYQTGGIVGWGDNSYGECNVPTGNNFVAIAAGRDYGLALKSDGSIVGWGRNNYGQATPPAGNNFTAVAAGWNHGLALKSDGNIVGWGNNGSGQATPPEGNNFTAVAAGVGHSLALKSDGSIIGWGDNYYGQATPPSGNNFVAIAAGMDYGLALKSDGNIVGWGRNYDGDATPPAENDFVAIAAGGYNSLALKSDGSIVCWGNNDFGESTPPVGNNFIAIAAGFYYNLALKSDGSIAGWGRNESDFPPPGSSGWATPPAGNNFIAIAAGYEHSLALRVCPFNLAGDLNNDCRVDLADFAIFAGNWLVDCYANPNNPACVPK